ncbi:transporter [Halobium palmae]|uniref:Transporter n=1 Tax=Halobium palmae TaxID=1776492 RepID=A0ABD5S532_9EURY
MKASTIVIVLGALLAIFGLPIPGLSVLGILIVLLGLGARYVDF